MSYKSSLDRSGNKQDD